MSNDVVAVVVVTHNSADAIEALLDSLPAAKGDLAYTTVVVDNESSDTTVDLVTARPDVTLLRRPNLGYAAGINAGVELLGSDPTAVLVLNPDLRLEPLAAVIMNDRLLADRAGIVVPRVLDPGGTVTRSLRRDPTLARALGLSFTRSPRFSEYVDDPAAYDRVHEVDWALGAVMLYRRDLHDLLGGWDESFFLYSEETDFCLRARDHGWSTVFEPRADAVHEGGGSGTSPRIHAMQIINRVRLHRRRYGRVSGGAYFAATVVSETTWILRGHRQSRTSVLMLLRPRLRPAEIGCGRSLVPR